MTTAKKQAARLIAMARQLLGEGYTPESQKLFDLLEAHYENVTYDEKTSSGTAILPLGELGNVTFEESGNGNGVIVRLPPMQFKTDAATAYRELKAIMSVFNRV